METDGRQFLASTTGDVHTSWIVVGLEACIAAAHELVGDDGHDMRDPDNWSGPDGEFFCWHRGYEDGSLTFQRIMTAPTVAPAPATPSPATVDVGEARKLERDAIIERCAEVADAASALGKMAGGTGIQGAVIATRIRALKAPQ